MLSRVDVYEVYDVVTFAPHVPYKAYLDVAVNYYYFKY